MASRRESMLMIRITRLPEYTPVTGAPVQVRLSFLTMTVLKML